MLVAPTDGEAQSSQIPFGVAQNDTAAPVEIDAQVLNVNQTDGTAVFTGDVIVSQSEMRLFAPRVRVVYKEDGRSVDRFEATGGVTVISGQDMAEASKADYFVTSGMVDMYGNVFLTSGPNTLASDRAELSRFEGTARAIGKVKMVMRSENSVSENE